MRKWLLLPLALIIVLAGCSVQQKLSPDEAKDKAEVFINENLMMPGSTVEIQDVQEEFGLYKVSVKLPDSETLVESYITKDGSTFFPQAMPVEETVPQISDNNTTAPAATPDVPKAAKANVELFVMSHCPYGTQIEKGMLPVLDALGDKIDFKLKFVDYAMHGEKELQEQLNQYCIQEEQNDKFLPYLQCFLEDGDSERCLDETKVNTRKLSSCVSDTDKEYQVTANYENKVGWKGSYPGFDIFKDDNTKYGVGGSPTLVINGSQISSGRDAASLLNTICAGFENAPEECNTQLSSASPSAGFGFNASGSGTAATCN